MRAPCRGLDWLVGWHWRMRGEEMDLRRARPRARGRRYSQAQARMNFGRAKMRAAHEDRAVLSDKSPGPSRTGHVGSSPAISISSRHHAIRTHEIRFADVGSTLTVETRRVVREVVNANGDHRRRGTALIHVIDVAHEEAINGWRPSYVSPKSGNFPRQIVENPNFEPQSSTHSKPLHTPACLSSVVVRLAQVAQLQCGAVDGPMRIWTNELRICETHGWILMYDRQARREAMKTPRPDQGLLSLACPPLVLDAVTMFILPAHAQLFAAAPPAPSPWGLGLTLGP
ncbi:hypothetical protein FB451DRAFT_1194785 [Mycena latifolia]|nr:hypothetical protein FB451DRAFT_1194785 [Mycena latifolia]